MAGLKQRDAETRREFSRSWRVVAAAMVGMGLGFGGLPMYSYGVFVQPLVQEHGWSLAEAGSWTFFANMGYVAMVAFCGRLTDRVGVRPVLLLAIPAFAMVIASMSLAGGRLWLLYGLAVLMGCVGTGTTAVTYTRAVNSWFSSGRGTALGLTSAGIGLVSMVAPSLLQGVINVAGWRAGFLTMAGLAMLAWPTGWFWLRERRAAMPAGVAAEPVPGDTRATAMRRPVFWLIAGGYLATCVANGGISTYLVSFLIDSGLPSTQAAAYAGIMGVASMSGRLFGGMVIDRFHYAVVCASLLFLQALACAAFAMHQVAFAPVLIFVIGFALGVEVDCMTYSTARLYGMRAFSEICGILGLMGGIGIASGAVLFGWLASSPWRYSAAFAVSAFLVGAGSLLFASARRYPLRADRAEDATSA